MSYLNSPGQPFRMPDSWYDPPELLPWKCTRCGNDGNESDFCDVCKGDEDDFALSAEDARYDYECDRADAARDDRFE